jgi:Carbohydrate binding domain
MQRTPPRHLAPQHRPRTRARDHLLAESLLAMVAIALTTALVIGSVVDRPDSSTVARLPHLPPPPPTTARTAGPDGNLVGDPSFEAGLAGWTALGGARLGRVDDARSGGWSASVAGGGKAPGMTLAALTAIQADKAYTATVWLRASRPSTTVQVNLVEVRGGRRYATDTGGTVLTGPGWQRLEVVHQVHEPGSRLAVEVLAPGLPGGSSLLVDDLAVVAKTASFMSRDG